MNWYFEEQGVSKGPYEEAEFVQMVHRREVPAGALVWKPDMNEWATVAEINPPWLSTPPVAEKSAKAAPVESSPKKKEKAPNAKATSTLSDDAPVIEVAVPTEAANAPQPVAMPKLKLQAPTPAPPEPAPPEKGGLLKRVFGFGKKK